ncbi:hypothetical protein QGP82_14025 [Leptothoe sp. LEGE 181152]|uniref:Uncharacterized protein n=1 Tax=Adonisia turfae CCMR0081 TaxID=2292702 RepID=A0A6M0RJS7_9CYAN|nr:hypothetical protein [Adonisia turfae]MDV3349819.1 hypothetical protein [Leptothoe sp. LEGE 181152]NEZ56032.1 hypothetical protein [Adonisia turfae CCMR0081]
MIDFKSVVISWKSFKSSFKFCFGFEYLTLEETLNQLSSRGNSISWKQLKNWEELEDIDIFKELPEHEKISGDIYVVTEASYKKELGPFKVHAADLECFITEHLNAYSECFFNGDVLITSTKDSCMWIFHHGGVMTFINEIQC